MPVLAEEAIELTSEPEVLDVHNAERRKSGESQAVDAGVEDAEPSARLRACRARHVAIVRPMPVFAPVTRATFLPLMRK